MLGICMYLIFGLITALVVPEFQKEGFKLSLLIVLVWPLFFGGLLIGYIHGRFDK